MTATIATEAPPSPIWESRDHGGLAVWVNGGLIEVTAGMDFARFDADEAAELPVPFAQAIAEARAWAARWDVYTGTYRPATDPACVVCESTDCVVPFLHTHVCAHCFNTATLGDVRDATAAR